MKKVDQIYKLTVYSLSLDFITLAIFFLSHYLILQSVLCKCVIIRYIYTHTNTRSLAIIIILLSLVYPTLIMPHYIRHMQSKCDIKNNADAALLCSNLFP